MKSKSFYLLFIFFSVSLHSLEIDFSVKNLWTEKSTSSGGFDFSILEEIKNEKQTVKSQTYISSVKSNLDYLNGDFLCCDFDFIFQGQFFESNTHFFVPHLQNFFLEIKDKNFLFTESLSGLGVFQGFSFNVKESKISPFIQYVNLPSTSGEFYWFNGEIGIPKVWSVGIKGNFRNHQVDCLYSSAKINALNDTNDSLGNIFAKNIIAKYEYLFKFEQFLFSLSTGYGDFWGNIDFFLNNQNQRYLLFPYVYCNCKGNINAQYFLFGFDSIFSRKRFELNIKTNGVFCFNQTGIVNRDWKYKKNLFFDGTSGSEQKELDLIDEKGLLLIDVNSSYKFNIASTSNKLYLQKTFVIPLVGKKKISPENSIDSEKIKSWLFSGLSLGISTKF